MNLAVVSFYLFLFNNKKHIIRMSLSIKGKLSRKLSVESGTSKAGKEWQKQSFLVDTGAQYNPEVCFQLFGEDKIQMLNSHQEGDQVEVSFNLSSREYNGRYFHNGSWHTAHWHSGSGGSGYNPGGTTINKKSTKRGS